MRIDITDADIEYVERLLLPPAYHFNDERRAFIRCMESRDVVACPGSGKTTALLAKLLILAKKMPFEDGRGICVLTHTNVAIDEIKKRAGIASSSLFRYPNFFGTIQSFVNQFFAAPWYRSEFGRPIVAIENDRFFWELEKLYQREYGLSKWLKPRGGLDTLGNYWFNPNTLIVGKSLYESIPNLSETKPTYQKIQSIRTEILSRGILSYNDAYALALRYLVKMPEAAQAVSARFCMVFLDEIQDTDQHQFRILDAVFQLEQVVVQRIGDPNQAIYHDRVQSDGYWEPNNPLHFSDSRRYGKTITRILSTIRLDDSIILQPSSVPSYPPFLITFEDGQEQEVLRAFSYLIEGLAGPLPPNCTCKAVGWMGKDKTADEKLCIPSYFPEFDKSHRTPNRRFPNLISYAAFAIQSAQTDGPRRFLEIVLQGIARGLNITGIRDETSGRSFTVASLKYFLKRAHEETYLQFRERLAESFLLALKSSISPAVLRDQITSAVQFIWPSLDMNDDFFTQDEIETSVELSPDSENANNRFVSDNGITIEVGTVHSVKGETHFATLYLETKYQRDHDASRLVEFLKGKRPKAQLKKAHHKQNLKIAHVAFSRPTHLLAFACQASSIAGHEDDLKNNGWQIRTVSELIASRSPGGG